jgi:hypothetical protein
MNDALIDPSAIEQVSEAIASPSEIEQAVSLVENPAPEICTVDPTVAEAGLRVMDNVPPLTVKVSDPESSSGLPVAVTE